MRKTGQALLVVVAILVGIGMLTLASATGLKGVAEKGDPFWYVRQQAMFLGVGVALATIAAFFDYHRFRSKPLLIGLAILTVLLLVLVFVPGFGAAVKGSRRWIRLVGLPIRVQPSEFAKLTVVVILSAWMALKGRKAENLKEGLIIPLGVLGLILLLILAEPDLGTTVLLAATGVILLLAGGSRKSHVLVSCVLGACGLVLMVLQDPVRMKRLLAFARPEGYADARYQLTQSENAFFLGGLWGRGYGEGMQKLGFLPEAHNDFIFAVLGEELGLPATLAVVALFAMLTVLGFRISRQAPDRFGCLLALGLTSLLALEAIINIGVVTGCLPTKGLALPFMSAGGSSLISSLVAVGMLINVARHADGTDRHTRLTREFDEQAMDRALQGGDIFA